MLFDRIVLPEDVLATDILPARFPEFNWDRLQASGISIPADIARRLETLWEAHVASVAQSPLPNELAVPVAYLEGATRQVLINAYERNPNARCDCVRHYGVSCVICGFNFGRAYGEIGEGFIHVHHLKDLATVGREYEVNPIEDLRPVCPNCHAMLHVERPAMTLERLRAILESARGQSIAPAVIRTHTLPMQ